MKQNSLKLIVARLLPVKIPRNLLVGSFVSVALLCGSQYSNPEDYPDARNSPVPLGPGVACAAASAKRGFSDIDEASGACLDGTGTCAVVRYASGTPPWKPQLAAIARRTLPALAPISFPALQCRQIPLADSPGWLTTPFRIGSDYIGMLDGHRSEISLYDLTGHLQRRFITGTPLEALAVENGRVLAKGRGDIFFLLDNNLNEVGSFTFPGFRSLYSNWVLNGNEIVGYGSVANPKFAGTNNNGGKPFHLGFIRINMSKRSSEMVLPFDENNIYLLNQQYFATSGGQAYFLALSSRPVIYRLPSGRGASRIGAMPDEFASIPALENITWPSGPSATAKRFELLESLHMPVGLYGYQGSLYLLGRRPDACRPWSLYKIDPATESVVGPIILPSFARHITLMPSDRHWLIIEKSRAVVAGSQRVKALQAVPTDWITDMRESPLRSQSGVVDCLNGD